MAPAPAPPECPICMDQMQDCDVKNPLLCPTKCGYNFCSRCIEHLIISSKSDYEEASDGSRQVKVKLICPQCRSDLSDTINDTLACRKSAMANQYRSHNDNELTASELRLKYAAQSNTSSPPPGLAPSRTASGSFEDEPTTNNFKHGTGITVVDPELFCGLEFAMTEAEQLYVTELMTSGDVHKVAQAAQILASISDMSRKGITPSMRNANAGGADDTSSVRSTSSRSLGSAPRSTTNNADYKRTAAATRQLRMGYSNHTAVGRALAMGRTQAERTKLAAESRIEAHRKKYPIPARMPRHVTLEATGEPLGKKFVLYFEDDAWDGSVADAFTRAHTRKKKDVGSRRWWGKKEVERVKRLEQQQQQQNVEGAPSHGRRNSTGSELVQRQGRILVTQARGQASRLGIQRGDVITHLNGEVFTGNASDLLHTLHVLCLDADVPVFSLVLNAEAATVEALRRRHIRA